MSSSRTAARVAASPRKVPRGIVRWLYARSSLLPALSVALLVGLATPAAGLPGAGMGGVLGTVRAAAPGSLTAPTTTSHRLTVGMVVGALRRAGLTLDTPLRQPVEGDPSGPPLTEREAWGLALHRVAHGEMRLLLFDTLARRDTKAAWYQSVGARIVVHLNAILWLDPHLSSRLATRCRQALDRLR